MAEIVTLPASRGPYGKMHVTMEPGVCGFHNLVIQAEEPLPEVWSCVMLGAPRLFIFTKCLKPGVIKFMCMIFQRLSTELYLQGVYIVQMCVAKGFSQHEKTTGTLSRSSS